MAGTSPAMTRIANESKRLVLPNHLVIKLRFEADENTPAEIENGAFTGADRSR
jgi:hypothetical protein